jgi:serine/threonine protein kinase
VPIVRFRSRETSRDMAVTVSQFLQHLESSGLLEADDLIAARSYAKSSEVADGQALAVHLIKSQKLTPYQAKQLLAGHTRGFFLEKYKILEPIGRGGMGLVFKAEHILLGRQAAIKVLPRKAASDRESVARFRREARATAQLEHENIVRVYDVSHFGEAHFIAMELVPGMSLGRTIKARGKLPVAESVSIIYQVALGLDHAFSKGITHRDIKPSNILVTPDGKAKILDMGLARVFGLTAEEGANQLSLTMSGTVVGTVDYVAPEQADDSHKADVRSDIYSLGCTLYECLTGRVPFPGGTMMQKLMKHYRSNPTEIKELTSDVPDELVAIVNRMMAKLARDRFQRPSEVAQALTRFLAPATPNRPSGFDVAIPQPTNEATRNDSVVETADPTLLNRRDSDRPSDSSRPTLPTIPLRTPSRTKQAAAAAAAPGLKEPAAPGTGTRASPPKAPSPRTKSAKPARESQPVPAATAAPPAPAVNPPARSPKSDPDLNPPAETNAPITDSTLRSGGGSGNRTSIDDQDVNEILEAIAVAASESPPSTASSHSPALVWTPTHTIVAAVLAAFVVLGSTLTIWVNTRPGILVLQFPERYAADLNSSDFGTKGRLIVDGQTLPLTKLRQQEFRVKSGEHKVIVDFPDLTPINEIISISRASPTIIDLTPTRDKTRRWILMDLANRIEPDSAQTLDQKSVERLRLDLTAFAYNCRGTPEGLDALALRGRLPWPLNRLKEAEGTKSLVSVAASPQSRPLQVSSLAVLPAPAPGNKVSSLSFSPNGRFLACGRDDGSVQLWDVTAPPEFRTLGRHGKPIVLAAFSSDAGLTTVSGDKIVFWDASSGKERGKVEGITDRLAAAAQSYDGRTLACVFHEGYAKIFDAMSGVEKHQLLGIASAARSAALSSDGNAIAIGATDNVEVWSLMTSKPIAMVKNSPSITALAFSDDDQWLSLVNQEGNAKVCKWGATQFTVRIEQRCTYLAFSPLVRSLAAVIGGRTVQVFDTASGEIDATLELDPAAAPIHQLAFAPDGTHLAIADAQGVVHIIQIRVE